MCQWHFEMGRCRSLGKDHQTCCFASNALPPPLWFLLFYSTWPSLPSSLGNFPGTGQFWVDARRKQLRKDSGWCPGKKLSIGNMHDLYSSLQTWVSPTPCFRQWGNQSHWGCNALSYFQRRSGESLKYGDKLWKSPRLEATEAAPSPCDSKSDLPVEKDPLAPQEQQARAMLQEPSTSTAGPLLWRWEVQSNVSTALIRRIHYLIFVE